MSVTKFFAVLFGGWLAIANHALAQNPVVGPTNYVTVFFTNYISVTNFVTITNFLSTTNLVMGTNLVTANHLGLATNSLVKPILGKATVVVVPPPKPKWDSVLTLGVTLTRGNSDSLLATSKIVSDKKLVNDHFQLEGDATYGSASGVANSELLHGFGQWDHLFSTNWYDYLRLDGVHDGIAEVKYRFTFTSGLGYYLIKDTNTTLALESGPGIVAERLGNENDTYATLRIADRFEHKFNHDASRIWENFEILPQINQPSVYIINAEIGVESSIYKALDLQVYMDDSYNSQPASGLLRNDVKLVSAVTYKF